LISLLALELGNLNWSYTKGRPSRPSISSPFVTAGFIYEYILILLELQLPWLDHNCLVWNARVTDSLEYCLVWNTGVSDSLEYCLVWNIGFTVVPDYCLFQNTTITVLDCRSVRDLWSPRVFCIHPIVYI
jgi:hypothetical protein